jgi:glucosylglycerate synthase
MEVATELEAIPQWTEEQTERFQNADLVVGMLGPSPNGRTAATAKMVRETIERFPNHPRAVLVADAGIDEPRIEDQEQPLPILFCKLSDPGAVDVTPKSIFDGYQTILAVADRIGARACGVIASEFQSGSPQRLDQLIRPVLEMEFDVVAPRYTRSKWEGLINRSILYPLSRALYGRQVQNPMGPDFGLSAKMLRAIRRENGGVQRVGPLASIVSAAVSEGLQICEVEMGIRLQPPTNWTNLSTLLTQILGPVFLDMERNVAIWQRIRGSSTVPAFGILEHAPEDAAVDVGPLIDSFHLGARNLRDIWSLVLPPTARLEIQKVSRLRPEQFRVPDDLWAGIVYDFALAHRLRTIDRDHLLRSFTPLYLSWIASHAVEMKDADRPAMETRLEQLALAYEAGKPYAVSRWRWPDRFNP